MNTDFFAEIIAQSWKMKEVVKKQENSHCLMLHYLFKVKQEQEKISLLKLAIFLALDGRINLLR